MLLRPCNRELWFERYRLDSWVCWGIFKCINAGSNHSARLDLFLAQADHCSISVPAGRAVVDSYANGLSLGLANLSGERPEREEDTHTQTEKGTTS